MPNLIDGLPADFTPLSMDVLHDLRADTPGTYDTLTSRQQRSYAELGALSLDFLRNNPDAATWGRLGPNEEGAYGVFLGDVDGAEVRVHFYAGEGAQVVSANEFDTSPIDVTRFGTPHTHAGHISALAPVGKIVHHTFARVPGADYTAGKIEFVQTSNPGTDFKYSKSVFVPTGAAGLDPLGSTAFDARGGYRMDRDVVHVVSWERPTVTVFIMDYNDDGSPTKNTSTVFQRGGLTEQIPRSRVLSPDEQQAVRSAFLDAVSGAS